MKKWTVFILTLLMATNAFAFKLFDDVRIVDVLHVGSASTPDTSALLEVRGTDGGLLPPRMTQAQRDAIGGPSDGLLIYNTDTRDIDVFNSNSTAWETISIIPASSVGLQGQYEASTTPQITISATLGGLAVQDSVVPSAGNLFEVKDSAGVDIFTIEPTVGMSTTLATLGNLNVTTNTITSTNVTGNINFAPNGAGVIISVNEHWFQKAVQFDEVATPGNPTIGQNMLYFKADGNLYKLDDVGTETQVDAGGLADPMTTRGDIIIRDAANATARLAVGGAAQVLTSDGTDVSWAAAAAGFADPMTTRGDVIIRNAANATDRLAVGGAGEVLTSDGTDIAWAASAAGFADPMTTRGDVIIRNAANATARLGVGTVGQVLSSDGTDIAWGADVGFADPMTTRGDVLIRNAANATARLAVGGAAQVLTSDGTDVAWAAAAAGFADPMTTRGDIIIRNAANATARLGVGTAGQIILSDGVDLAWAEIPAISLVSIQDTYDEGGGALPEITVDATRLGMQIKDNAAPIGDALLEVLDNADEPLFAVDTASTTIASLRVDDLRMDDNTLSVTLTNGDLVLSPNGTGDLFIQSAEVVLDQAIQFTQIATPANPAALSNKLYFKSDDNLYKLDSAGTETEVGGAAASQTTFAAANNQSAATNVTGLTFNTKKGGHAIMAVQLDATADLANLCILNAIDNNGTFILSQECTGDPSLDVVFSIVAGTGQVQYTSDNYAGFVTLAMNWKETFID